MSTLLDFQTKLEDIYCSLNLLTFDVIYIYSDLRGFASQPLLTSGKDEFLRSFIRPFDLNKYTIIIPSFTYTVSGIFDTLSTRTRLGALNTYILEHTNCYRSEHPFFLMLL